MLTLQLHDIATDSKVAVTIKGTMAILDVNTSKF